MPNMFAPGISLVARKKPRTTPNTPINSRYRKTMNITLGEIPSSTIREPAKRVIINNYNIIEHTPPSHSTSACEEDLNGLFTKSLPQGTKYQLNKMNAVKPSPDYGFSSTLSGEKDYKRLPKKSFIEDGGMSVLPMATG